MWRGEYERPTIDRREAAEKLNVTLSTLWRCAKEGYLVPVKIGAKVLYRASDIDKMLTQHLNKNQNGTDHKQPADPTGTASL